jgi:hypothetical protein
VRGWKLPILIERAPRFYTPVVRARFDDPGNLYLACDDYSPPLTNLELYLQISEHCKGVPKPEAMACIQPQDVLPNKFHKYSVVTGAFISDVRMPRVPMLVLSPFTTEIPDTAARYW